jgi:hypothetical protein
MSCDLCPHCRALSDPAAFRLPGPPSSSPQTGTDVAFYRSFALAHEQARQRNLRPRQALMAANDWLTASQCAAYLKRARALGLVQAPLRTAEPPAPAPRRRNTQRTVDWTPARSEEVWFSEDDATDLLMRQASKMGTPITVATLRATSPTRMTPGQAQAVLTWAVAEGQAEWLPDGDGVRLTED